MNIHNNKGRPPAAAIERPPRAHAGVPTVPPWPGQAARVPGQGTRGFGQHLRVTGVPIR